MVLLNVADLSTDNAYTAHLFWPEEKEETDKGMSLFADAVCGKGGFDQSHLVPASHYPQAMGEEWEQAEHVDGLAGLLTRLTVDGYMCQECVNEYRAEVGGVRGLGRRYYPDEHDVEETEVGEFSGLEDLVGESGVAQTVAVGKAEVPEITWEEYQAALREAEEDGEVVPFELFTALSEEAGCTKAEAAKWALENMEDMGEEGS